MSGRLEDPGFLTGRTPFLRDLRAEDCLHVAFVRSIVPHAELAAIRVDDARKLPGVAAVLTASDLSLAPFRFYDAIPEPFARPPLAVDRILTVGELIAVVVADTPANALDAAETVEVVTTPLPAVLTADEAIDAPPLFPGTDSNVAMSYQRARNDQLFDLAAHVEIGRFPNQRLCSAPMEATAVIVRPTVEGGIDVWATGQGPHVIKHELAKALEIAEDLVRVRSVAVGGGFGGRHSAPIEVLVVAATARHLGRPVRWDETRTENLSSMVHGRAQDHRVEMGFDDDGLIVGLRVHNQADCGAYPHLGPLMPFMCRKLAPGPYRIPAVDYTWAGIVTNTNPVGPYRGAGQPEVTNGLERSIENAARSLGIDPVELRRRNLLRSDELASPTATGLTYDAGDFVAALDRAVELVDYDEVRAEQRRRRDAGLRLQLGVGFACYVSAVDVSPEFAEVGIDSSGRVFVRCGTFSHGQSHASTIGTLVAAQFGLDPADIDYLDNDTDATPRGAGTGGSRSAQMAGGGALAAARVVVERAKELAAELLEADPADLVIMADPEPGCSSGLGVAGVPASVIGWGALAIAAAERGQTLTESIDFNSPATYPSGTHASVVEVDTETGHVRLVAHVAVDDCGTVLNPPIVEGQQHGGSAAGIGQALFEEFVYDATGTPRSVTFADYLLPSAAELPSFVTHTMNRPSPASITGAKGIGENGAIAAPTAVQNAVIDALAPFGVEHIDLPVTPERVWQALRSTSATVSRG